MRALLLRFDAALQSYGSEAVDSRRPVSELPGLSMIVGLLCNALGYRRTDHGLLQALQSRVTYAVRLDRRGEPMRDFQTAELAKNDVMWSSWGERQERDGGATTYQSPHIRWMDYHADRVCTLAVSLRDGQGPTLDDLARALTSPARPLFLGRKTCVPAGPILVGEGEGFDPFDVLLRAPLPDGSDEGNLLVQIDGDDVPEGWRGLQVTDACSWRTRIFGGSRPVTQGYVEHCAFGEAA